MRLSDPTDQPTLAPAAGNVYHDEPITDEDILAEMPIASNYVSHGIMAVSSDSTALGHRPAVVLAREAINLKLSAEPEANFQLAPLQQDNAPPP
eukprot:2615762-Pleurochrysis_carterae.AAC.1